jgi:excisionase family DNA binding protein
MITERLLTPLEVAERCGLSRLAIYRAIERGELPASKLCGRLRLRPTDVEAWIEARRVQPSGLAPPSAPPRLPALPAQGSMRALLRREQG